MRTPCVSRGAHFLAGTFYMWERYGADFARDENGPLHKEYEFLMPIQNTCPWPKPCARLDNSNTYPPPFIGKDHL